MEQFEYAESVLRQYDRIDLTDIETRNSILKDLFSEMGDDVALMSGFHCEFGSHITINYNCTFLDNTNITIGNHVLIGPDERAEGYCMNQPIHIGNKVLIGGNVTILAVMTKDIPAGGDCCR